MPPEGLLCANFLPRFKIITLLIIMCVVFFIQSHDCINGVDPEKGAPVVVRWTDNELYNGKFVKSYYVKLYDVEFENESVVTVKREDIYATEEPLPKRVKTRFVSLVCSNNLSVFICIVYDN